MIDSSAAAAQNKTESVVFFDVRLTTCPRSVNVPVTLRKQLLLSNSHSHPLMKSVVKAFRDLFLFEQFSPTAQHCPCLPGSRNELIGLSNGECSSRLRLCLADE